MNPPTKISTSTRMITFEQWWARLKDAIPMTENEQKNLRSAFAGCWNQALDVAAVNIVSNPNLPTSFTTEVMHNLAALQAKS